MSPGTWDQYVECQVGPLNCSKYKYNTYEMLRRKTVLSVCTSEWRIYGEKGRIAAKMSNSICVHHVGGEGQGMKRKRVGRDSSSLIPERYFTAAAANLAPSKEDIIGMKKQCLYLHK